MTITVSTHLLIHYKLIYISHKILNNVLLNNVNIHFLYYVGIVMGNLNFVYYKQVIKVLKSQK